MYGSDRFVSVASDDDNSDGRSDEPGGARTEPQSVEEAIAGMDGHEEYIMGLPPEAQDALLDAMAAMGMTDEEGDTRSERHPAQVHRSQPLPEVLLSGRTASGHMSQAPPPAPVGPTVAASLAARNHSSSLSTEDGVHITLASENSPLSADDMCMIGHDVGSSTFANMKKAGGDGGGGNEKALSKIRALFCSQIVQKDANPVWNQTLVLNKAFLASDLREPFDFRRPAVPKARIKGQNVLLLLTVHDSDMFNEDEFVGRVVLPSLSCGQTLHDWFPLQTKDGVEIIGESGRKARVNIKVEYKVKGRQTGNHAVDNPCQAKDAAEKALGSPGAQATAIKSPEASHVDTIVPISPAGLQSFMKADHDKQTTVKSRGSWMQRRQRALDIYSEERVAESFEAKTREGNRDFNVSGIHAQNGHSGERARTALTRVQQDLSNYSPLQSSNSRVQRSVPRQEPFSSDGIGKNPGTDGCERMDYVLKIVVAEARFLPSSRHSSQGAELRKPDTVACITLVSQPEMMQHEHFVQMGHNVWSDSSIARVTDEYMDSDADVHLSPLFFPPQEQTHVFKGSSHPSWNSTLNFTQSYPNIHAIEAASAQGTLHTFGQNRVDLDGSAVLMLVTLHAVDGDSIRTIGKVLVPFIRLGTRVDQWFILQDQKGEPLASHTILPPSIRLRVHYSSPVAMSANAGRIFTSPTPSHAHPDRLPSGGRQTSFSSPSPIMQTPRASGSKYHTSTLSPAPSALKIRIIEVRGIAVPDEILCNSTRNVELQFFLNLLDYPTIKALGTDVQVKIDHVVSEHQEPDLQGGNFVSSNGHFLLRPQCATKCKVLSAGGATWNDEFRLYSVFPCLETLHRSFKSGEMRMLEQEIVLRGQRIVAFLTLQLVQNQFVSKLAHAAIELDPGMSGSDSWHLLYLPSGDPMVGPRRHAAMVCIAVEYDMAEPSDSNMTTSRHSPETPLSCPSAPRQYPAETTRLNRNPISIPRVSPCVEAKVHVVIFEGRNFAMLREPEAGSRILCEVVLQRHGCEDKILRTSSVGDSSAPNFGAAEFHFEAALATLETAVLKVNVVLVRLHTNEQAVKRIGKARRIKLSEVMRQGTVTSWVDVHRRGGAESDSPSQARPEPLSAREERRPYISPFQTLKDEKMRMLMMASPGTPHHKSLDFSFEHETSRIDLGDGGDSSKGRNFMTVDMLLSDDESHNDRMLRAELRSNDDMQRLQLERRIHSPKVADEGAAIRMQIRYEPPDVLPPAPSSSQKTPLGMVKSEQSKQLSFSSPGDKSPLKVGGVGICFRTGPRGEHVVDYLIQGGAAERSSHIFPGDTLFDVDGRPVSKMTIQEVQQLLRGEVSSPVSMTFLHDGAQVMVTVLRRPLKSSSPSPSPHRRPATIPRSEQMTSIPRQNLSEGTGAVEVARRENSVSDRGLGATTNATNSDRSLRSLQTVSQQDLTMARLELAAMAEGKAPSMREDKAEKILIAELM